MHKAFKIGLIIKAIDGLLEVIGGILLVAIPARAITSFASALTQHELSQDPDDIVANYIVRTVHHLSVSSAIFGSIYLIIHGLVKIVLVIAMLKHKLWAYPWMMGFLTVFIVYQLYRIAGNLSVGLTILTVFDLFFFWLTWREYRKLKSTT